MVEGTPPTVGSAAIVRSTAMGSDQSRRLQDWPKKCNHQVKMENDNPSMEDIREMEEDDEREDDIANCAKAEPTQLANVEATNKSLNVNEGYDNLSLVEETMRCMGLRELNGTNNTVVIDSSDTNWNAGAMALEKGISNGARSISSGPTKRLLGIIGVILGLIDPLPQPIESGPNQIVLNRELRMRGNHNGALQHLEVVKSNDGIM
ncbi:hypothetical protein F0562_011529 [Nyssa sinensis]|uniref:Uncharacterized protein n=1 Tax=Nyssa sinensis TaxID=561372 RepID=A0A5J4ZSS8_9ASTE|nr:hypothetical protein F0562_011529 [Nyssa sinensis]